MQQWDLLHRIRDLRANSRMYPDLLGDGNVVLKDENPWKDQIRIVDTIPVVPELLMAPIATDNPLSCDEYYEKHVLGAWFEALEATAE